MTTKFCSVRKKKVQTLLGVIISALLQERRLNQASLAAHLNVIDSNLSQRLRIGTMTQEMLKQTGDFFDVNLLDLIVRHEKGETIEDFMAEKNCETVGAGLFLSDEEVKEVIKNQTKSHEQLMADFHALVGQIRTWLEDDRQKSLRQEELINLLMEERAEYKAKKKYHQMEKPTTLQILEALNEFYRCLSSDLDNNKKSDRIQCIFKGTPQEFEFPKVPDLIDTSITYNQVFIYRTLFLISNEKNELEIHLDFKGVRASLREKFTFKDIIVSNSYSEWHILDDISIENNQILFKHSYNQNAHRIVLDFS
jgi:hypothetical protein